MDFNIPTGRVVQGSLHKKGEKDMQGRPIPLDKQRIYFGVAVPKQSPGVLDVINALVNFAWTESANKRNAAGQAVGPTIQAAIVRVAQNMADPGYSLKIEDGDPVLQPLAMSQQRLVALHADVSRCRDDRDFARARALRVRFVLPQLRIALRRQRTIALGLLRLQPLHLHLPQKSKSNKRPASIFSMLALLILAR